MLLDGLTAVESVDEVASTPAADQDDEHAGFLFNVYVDCLALPCLSAQPRCARRLKARHANLSAELDALRHDLMQHGPVLKKLKVVAV